MNIIIIFSKLKSSGDQVLQRGLYSEKYPLVKIQDFLQRDRELPTWYGKENNDEDFFPEESNVKQRDEYGFDNSGDDSKD